MSRRAATIALAASLLAPASAGASGTRPPVSIVASPPHVRLGGTAAGAIRLTNTGGRAVVVEVARAGFALDRRGRPRIATRTRSTAAATSWLRFAPHTVALPRNGSASLAVAAALPRHPEPGDHDALVLLTTRPLGAAGVGFRTRIGVVVSIRVPGHVVHRLAPLHVRVRRHGRARLLELAVANRGNVTETIGRRRIRIELRRRGVVLGALRPAPRELLPRTRGIVEFRYRGRVRGRVVAVVSVQFPGHGRAVLTRTLRVRL